MIWCTCIQKIRDKNNIITHYEVVDMNGLHRTVTKDILKSAILSGQLGVVNLNLTKDGKLMDRNTEDQAKLMNKLGINTVTQKDNNAYMKSKLIGTAPTIDDNGMIIGWPSSQLVAITPNIKGVNNISMVPAKDKTLIFYGNNEFIIKGWNIKVDKVVIKNPTIISNIINQDLLANIIEICYDNMDTKILDIIFKVYKTDRRTYDNQKMTKFIISGEKIDKQDAFNKTLKILDRQKPSSKNDRRAYDIVAYLRLINTVYESYSDKLILNKAYKYIDEYKNIIKYASLQTSEFSNFLQYNYDSINELIKTITTIN